ncbi:MAG: type II CRISPR-associated endonuclease Cas1 [Bacteroidia bacterium]
MIKKTIYVGNPYHINVCNSQLVLATPNAKGIDKVFNQSIALEDIGVIILDNQQISITQHVLQQIANYNIACVVCNQNHMPALLQLPLEAHTIQQERFENQINASEPLKKQLWQQTIKQKITNQGKLIRKMGIETDAFEHLAKKVKSGDTGNEEAKASVIYWKLFFSKFFDGFVRDRFAPYPNNFLNYGYAVLRATVARSLSGSGLLPTLGIFHKNRYNAFCLADDIMEPYRPFVDELVYRIIAENKGETNLTKPIKQQLLTIPVLDVLIEGQQSPLMVATQRTSASLAKCFAGEARKILYPDIT